MSDREQQDQPDLEESTGDPDSHSTWNTIEGTVSADDLLNDEDFENLLIEPTTGELGILSDTDVPGEPG
jgi:hypothetical protein